MVGTLAIGRPQNIVHSNQVCETCFYVSVAIPDLDHCEFLANREIKSSVSVLELLACLKQGRIYTE